jgi:hypothetical protein
MRILQLTPNELSWDVFGYYLYLPATFIHHDPLLHDTAWIHELVRARPEISGTLYQLSTAPDGSPMYFFLMGMSLLYLPFFLIGHGVALLTGQPLDGFSTPYQVSLAIGCVVYTLIGLVHFRRILLTFFTECMTAVLLVIICIGTNWLQFMTVKNLETANALFMLMAVLVWNTMEWHRTERPRNMAGIAISLALMTLVKPSEVLAGLVPLMWGVHDKESLRSKWALLKQYRGQVYRAVGIGLLVMLPQVLYWWAVTGMPIYDSYKNPGVGLDLWRPHVADALFSFRKGWLLYTPVMSFALVGFYFLRKRQPKLFPAILIWFLAEFWIISSWSEWWYGGSFSVRPMVTTYVLLALPLGYCIEALSRTRPIWRAGMATVIIAMIGLNLFQTWQLHAYILDPFRTTKGYYLAIFGRTSVPPGAEKFKSVERSFDGSYSFPDPQDYRRFNIGHYDFEVKDTEHPGNYVYDTLAQSMTFRLDSGVHFSPGIRNTYDALTGKDHIRVKATVRILVPVGFQGDAPCLVFTMEHKGGSYGYITRSPSVEPDSLGKWQTVVLQYMSPPVREPNDRLISYVWGRSDSPVFIDDLDVQVFAPK